MMSELEKIVKTKSLIDQLANGINPLDQSPIPEGDLLNQVQISRCLFHVSEILRQVIENGGVESQTATKKQKKGFVLTEEARANLVPFECDVYAGKIVEHINDQLADSTTKMKLHALRRWLLQIGALEVVEDEGRQRLTIPTPLGLEIGLYLSTDHYSTGDRQCILYTPAAQQFIYDNIDALFASARPSALPEQYMKAWTKEEEQLLLELYENGVKIKEIAKTLKRTRGGIKARLKRLDRL